MTDNLFATIRNYVDLPQDQEQTLKGIVQKISLKKGEYFIREGHIPKRMAFVNKGLFRYVYVDNKGNEFTKGFFPENTFLSSYSSMVQQIPSYFSIEALEDAEILAFDYDSWKTILEKHPVWKQLLIEMLEKAFIKKERRERELLLFDAEKRYIMFLHEYPGINLRVKQHYIASYLGITTVALSRVRKKMGLINKG